MEEQHPFLSEASHRELVLNLVNKFLSENLNLSFQQIKIGHLFFGQRVLPLAGRDIGFVYSDKARYYPSNDDLSISPGILILVDEVGSRFDIGISEISQDEIGVYFENILINIQIPKESSEDVSHFDGEDFFFEIYYINNYGALVKLGLHDFPEIQNLFSKKILEIILFNLEKFS